jgi:hypothetical protein
MLPTRYSMHLSIMPDISPYFGIVFEVKLAIIGPVEKLRNIKESTNLTLDKKVDGIINSNSS